MRTNTQHPQRYHKTSARGAWRRKRCGRAATGFLATRRTSSETSLAASAGLPHRRKHCGLNPAMAELPRSAAGARFARRSAGPNWPPHGKSPQHSRHLYPASVPAPWPTALIVEEQFCAPKGQVAEEETPRRDASLSLASGLINMEAREAALGPSFIPAIGRCGHSTARGDSNAATRRCLTTTGIASPPHGAPATC